MAAPAPFAPAIPDMAFTVIVIVIVIVMGWGANEALERVEPSFRADFQSRSDGTT